MRPRREHPHHLEEARHKHQAEERQRGIPSTQTQARSHSRWVLTSRANVATNQNNVAAHATTPQQEGALDKARQPRNITDTTDITVVGNGGANNEVSESAIRDDLIRAPSADCRTKHIKVDVILFLSKFGSTSLWTAASFPTIPRTRACTCFWPSSDTAALKVGSSEASDLRSLLAARLLCQQICRRGTLSSHSYDAPPPVDIIIYWFSRLRTAVKLLCLCQCGDAGPLSWLCLGVVSRQCKGASLFLSWDDCIALK